MQIGVGQPAVTPEFQAPQMQGEVAGEHFQKLLEFNSAVPGADPQMAADGPVADIGEKLLDRLEEFAGRAREFSKVAMTEKPAQSPSEERVKSAVQSLEKMFDHSIEVQLVVRGSTQISGSANTLLRGQ
jgi:hypothetical protein